MGHGPKIPMLLFCEQSAELPTLYVELHPVQADARIHTEEQLRELEACLGEPEKRPPSQLVGGLLRAVVSGQQRRSDWSGMLVSCRLLLAVEPFDRITDRVMQAQLLLRVAHDPEGALNDLKLVAKSEWKDSVELRELYS